MAHEMVYELELDRVYFDDDPDEPVSWGGGMGPGRAAARPPRTTPRIWPMWWLRSWRTPAGSLPPGRPVRIDRRLGGDPQPEGSVTDAVAAEGVALLGRVLPPRMDHG